MIRFSKRGQKFGIGEVLGCLVIAATASGCSVTAPVAATADEVTAASALALVESQMEAVGALDYSSTATARIARLGKVSKSLLGVSGVRSASTAFGGTSWDTDLVTRKFDTTNTTYTLKDYMGFQLNPDAMGEGDGGRAYAINVFGRYKNSTMIACAILRSLEAGSDGYPAAGSSTITLNATLLAMMVESCHMSQSEADSMASAGLSITAVVSVPEDTSVYDRKIVMVLPAEMSGSTQSIYVRYNASAINILNVEVGSSNSSRTLVAYDVASQTLKVEYYSGNASAFYYNRLYYDAVADVGKMLGAVYGGTSNYLYYSLAGKPQAGGTLALSVDLSNGAGFSGDFDRAACVNASTGDIATDNSLACSVAGTDVDTIRTAFLDDAVTNKTAAGWVTLTDTLSVDWDVDTIFSQAGQF